MRTTLPRIIAAGVLLFAAGAVAVRTVHVIRASVASHPRAKSSDSDRQQAAAQLEFHELLDLQASVRPSAKAMALDGKRVCIVGFMADMEEPIEGAFYLVPRPIKLDESGAGTGDLPLESILVEVAGSEGKVLPHIQGALEGTGVLEVGNRADDHGRVSNFRLRLDPDYRLAYAARAATWTN